MAPITRAQVSYDTGGLDFAPRSSRTVELEICVELEVARLLHAAGGRRQTGFLCDVLFTSAWR